MRLPSALREATRGERAFVGAAMALSFALVIAYVLATRSHGLAGDEIEYHKQGELFAAGHLWWSEAPFGRPHPSAWKAPGYPGWVGFWYSVIGTSALRLALVQALLAPLTVLLGWLLARRLFDRRVALASAAGIAVFPLVWEYFGLLFPEALSIPLTLAALLAMLEREPTPVRVVLVGVLIGANLLVRPTAFFLLAAAAAAWIVAAGWRRGLALSAATAVVAVLLVVPWTVRNALTDEVGFIPISVQDAAAYGTFNAEAAADPEHPYAFRPQPRGVEDLFDPDEPISEATFRSRLQDLAIDYVKEHPLSVPQAIFWNGVTRFWDLRAPSKALIEVDFQGRSRLVRAAGLGLYYVLLPLAIIGLWRLRERRDLVIPLVAMALVATLAFVTVAGTRYRAPFEPVIVMLAAAALLARPGPRPSHPEASDSELPR